MGGHFVLSVVLTIFDSIESKSTTREVFEVRNEWSIITRLGCCPTTYGRASSAARACKTLPPYDIQVCNNDWPRERSGTGKNRMGHTIPAGDVEMKRGVQPRRGERLSDHIARKCPFHGQAFSSP